MKFEDFPLELLKQILNGDENSYVVVDLWKCGSSVLNGKLARGGVTDVCLIDKTEIEHCSSRWPRFLKELKLERLVIKTKNSALCSLETLRSELKKLNRGLKELKIAAIGADLAFFGNGKASTAEDADDEPRPAKRSKNFETEDSDLKHEELWNLDLTWPSLERLSVKGETHGSGTIDTRVFAVLPRSLLHLTLPTIFTRTPRDFSTLPPNLQTLRLRFETLDHKALKLLPNTITDIGLSLTEDAQLKLATRPHLLPNLKDFPFIDEDEANSELKLFYGDCTSKISWPANLKVLSFCETNAEEIFSKNITLPPQLQTLHIACSYSDYDITAKWLRKISHSLTSLRVDKIKWKEIDATMWPPLLTIMRLNDQHFRPLHFHKLPRTLITLDLGYFGCGSNSSPAFKLPEHLHAGRTSLSGNDKELWDTIKPTLIKQGHLFPTGDATAYIEAVENGRLFGLPLTLKELILTSYDHQDCFNLLTPPQVTKLQITFPANKIAAGFLELVPPSLTDLKFITNEQHEGNLELLVAKSKPGSSALSKAKNLRRVRFPASDAKSTAAIVKHLPRELQDLHIEDMNRMLKCEIARFLPPTLTRLSHHGRSISSRKNWVDLLPSTLIELELPYCYVLGSEFARLPRNLSILCVAMRDVLLPHFWDLPKTLIHARHGFIQRSEGFLRADAVRIVLLRFYNYFRIFEVPQAVVQLEIDEYCKDRPERSDDLFVVTEADGGKEDGDEELDNDENGSAEAENDEEDDDGEGDDDGEVNEEENENDAYADEDEDEEDGEDGGADGSEDDGEGDEDDEDGGDEDGNEGINESDDDEDSDSEDHVRPIEYPEQTDIDPRTIRRIRGL